MEKLATSLEVIARAARPKRSLETCFADGKILRSALLSLSRDEKKQVFATYLLRHNVRDFGLAHINELLKRLDVEKKDHTFRLAKMNWRANARHIWCEAGV